MAKNIQWYRSDEGVIAGVCKGFAETLDLDVGILRILFIAAVLFGGVGVLTYVALAIALPRKDRLHEAMQPKVLGVCAKIAQRTEIDVAIVRFLALCLAVMSLGITVVLYVIAYFLLPRSANHYRSARDVNDL